MKSGRKACVTTLLALVMSACGGGSGGGTSTPTSPTPPPVSTPAPTAPPPVATGPYSFDFAAGTSASDQELIRSATQFAHDFLQSTLGRTIEQPTTISGVASAQGCAQGGGAAFTGARSITFCLSNPGWTVHGPVTKQKIVIHEVYHVLQFERRWLGNPAAAGPDWIIEGAAEVIGYRGVASRNLLSYTTATGCQVKEVADFGTRQPPGLPNLNAIESRQQFQTTQGPLYALSMMGMDQLLSASSLTALNSYSDAIAAGTPWQTAFQSAFGTSTTTFYANFPGYRSGLAVPPAYLCSV